MGVHQRCLQSSVIFNQLLLDKFLQALQGLLINEGTSHSYGPAVDILTSSLKSLSHKKGEHEVISQSGKVVEIISTSQIMSVYFLDLHKKFEVVQYTVSQACGLHTFQAKGEDGDTKRGYDL